MSDDPQTHAAVKPSFHLSKTQTSQRSSNSDEWIINQKAQFDYCPLECELSHKMKWNQAKQEMYSVIALLRSDVPAAKQQPSKHAGSSSEMFWLWSGCS